MSRRIVDFINRNLIIFNVILYFNIYAIRFQITTELYYREFSIDTIANGIKGLKYGYKSHDDEQYSFMDSNKKHIDAHAGT